MHRFQSVNQLFSFFKAALRYSRAMAYLPEVDGADGWTKEDANALQSFMNTVPGQKLSQRLTNYAIRSATAAVRQPNEHINGQAAGVFNAITALESHLPVGQAQPEQVKEDPTLFDMKFAA